MSQNALVVGPASGPLRGALRVPGDKSIAHRALLLSALAEGHSRIRGLPEGDDVVATRRAIEALGVRVYPQDDRTLVVEGAGLHGLAAPARPIDCGGSATTARLLAGIAGGRGFSAVLTGDPTLERRPMRRIVEPLRRMNVEILGEGSGDEVFMPLTVGGDDPLRAIHHVTPVASAQVKSCILLAGLRARGVTAVTEPVRSRDHTETMLLSRGVPVARRGLTASLPGPVRRIEPMDVDVPGDPSSASFILAAALLIPGSRVEIEDVCLNPTRVGFVDALRRMGAALTAEHPREEGGEVVGTLLASAGEVLRGVEIRPGDVPSLIDEVPIIAVAAALADGVTTFRGCGEIKEKESDRLSAIVEMLHAFGVEAEEQGEGFVVRGTAGRPPKGGARFDPAGDHRLAMAAIVLAQLSSEESEIQGARATAASYPGFFAALQSLFSS